MAININSLLQLLDKAYVGASGQFTLDGATLGEPAIAAALSLWSADGTLSLTSVTAVPALVGNLIVVTGLSSFLGASNQNATLTFGVLDGSGNIAASGTPFFCYQITLPDSPAMTWSFSQAFAQLQNTCLDKLTYGGGTLFLCSDALPAIGSAPAVQAGLNFQATQVGTTHVDLGAIVSLVQGGAPALGLSGTIAILQGSIADPANLIPGFALQSPSGSHVFDALLTLPVTLTASCRIATANDAPAAPGSIYPQLLLSSSVTVAGVSLPLSADISDMGDMVELLADVSALSQLALSDASAFLANQNLTAPLGSLYTLGTDVSLQSLSVFLTPSAFSGPTPMDALAALRIVAGPIANPDWGIFGNTIVIDGLSFSFMLNNPIASADATPSLDLVVNGAAVIGDMDLSASASFPDPSFYVTATDSFSIDTLLSTFVSPPSGYPALTCDNLGITLTPNQGPYQLYTDVSSDWTFSAGAAAIAITGASVAFNYDTADGASGSLSGQATVTPANNASAIDLSLNCAIPGAFSLDGSFPDINLTDLAAQIANAADLPLPASFPAIALTNANVTMSVADQGALEYDFTLKAGASFNGTPLGVICEITKPAAGVQMLAGLWAPNWDFSPAQFNAWSLPFQSVLSLFTFSNAGFVVSSVDNAAVSFTRAPASIPATVQKGLTFFAGIAPVSGSLLSEALSTFFPNTDDITLYGVIADPLPSSKLVATIGDSSDANNYCFTGFTLTTDFNGPSLTMQAGVNFPFTQIAGKDKGQARQMLFSAGGAVTLGSAPAFDLYFALVPGNGPLPPPANGQPPQNYGWTDPLGVPGVTIDNFWGLISYAHDAPGFGFGGQIAIASRSGNVTLDLDVDIQMIGEAPDVKVFIFTLDDTSKGATIQLTDLIGAFISPDVPSVPVLDGITLKEVGLYLVSQPWQNPATGTSYQPGFMCSGNIGFYGLSALFDVTIEYSGGISASGSLSEPIDIGNGLFTFCAASDPAKGPAALIQNLTPDLPYVSIDGKVSLLGVAGESVKASVSNGGFSFSFDTKNGLYTEKMRCTLSCDAGGLPSLGGHCGFSAGINYTTPALTIGGISLGALKIDDTATGTLTIFAGAGGMSAKVNGSFTWQGHTISLDDGSGGLEISLSLFLELGGALEKAISGRLETLFADALKDPQAFILALLNGGIAGGDFVVNVLYDHYGVTSVEDLLDDMHQLLQHGFKIDGTLDFDLPVKFSIPPKSFYVDTGWGVHESFGTHFDIGYSDHTDIFHVDSDVGVTLNTPAISFNLIDLRKNLHLDLSSPQVHGDASAHADVSGGVSIPFASGNVHLAASASVNAKVDINDLTPSWSVHVNGTAQALVHVDVDGFGKGFRSPEVVINVDVP